MPITNYPKVLKYAIDDRLWFYQSRADDNGFGYPDGFLNERASGKIVRGKVTGWETVVRDSNGNGSGAPIQETFYFLKEILGYTSEDFESAVELYSPRDYKISASDLFTSKNHLLSAIKGKYINSPFGDLEDDAHLFFSKMGHPGTSLNNNGDWVDWAGMNFKNIDFSETVFNSTWVGGYVGGESGGTKSLIVDNCNLEGAALPAGYTAKGAFRGLLFSYDAKSTIWTDGFPIGRPVTGTVAGSLDGNTVTGSSTTFTSQLSVGDQIVIETVGVFTVTAIASNTSLTVAETFAGNFTGKTISRI